ncbi:hypothetical protein C5167_000312 [Papaver somniferum]|uniref:Uncharacterized protein n=1 Tax=Papaver somniferum TaxID=3469 RepID=A0A4Y7KV17_PAPSO|nr:uncharacterized protein LOC113309525 isoform X2 [Papaver somniferum]RZC76210.1 hypothetical protein C5167_000312 [Papaver somniferum]
MSGGRFEGIEGGSSSTLTTVNGGGRNYTSSSPTLSGRGGDVTGILSSGSTTSSRGSTTLSSVGLLPPLSQCIMLETITLDDQKGTRSGELKRIFNVADENSTTAQFKVGSPAMVEDVRRFRGSLVETSTKARDRVKKMQESVFKLDKYRFSYPPKRRAKLSPSGGTNAMVVGNQIQQNPMELVNQRLDKNVGLIKRVRTSVAESEARNIALSRQSVILDKDRDMLKSTSGGGSVQDEQKIRVMPAGGDGWDKRMKRKRSIGAVGNRAVDGDYEPKRAMHQKPTSDPRSRSLDPHGFGSCPSNGGSGINKFDVTSQLTSSNIRLTPKIELENISLQNDRKDRGMNKLDVTSQLSSNIRLTPKIEPENVSLQNDRRERGFGFDKERVVVVPKLNKLNILESNQIGCHSPVTKGKASRATRTGPGGINSSPNIPRTPGAHEISEQPSSLNKVQTLGGANNRKRPMSAGSPSPPVTQWLAQRSQKNSRTRRTNLISPVSIRDDIQAVPEGYPTPENGNRLMSSETTSQLHKGVSNRAQQYKMKPENVASPARFSESEESGAGENKMKDKHVDYGEIEDQSVDEVKKIGSIASSMKKNKVFVKEDVEDGPRRVGRSGRIQSVSRVSVPQIREKMDSPGTAKPVRSMRIGSEKNDSKPGRPPSKKFAERKVITRPGKALNSGSPGFTGESDDDHDELLEAANFALKSRYLACSGSFWKKVEPIFASVSSEDTIYLRQQLRFVEELDELFCDASGADLNDLGEVGWTEPVSKLNGNGLSISGKASDSLTQSQEFDTLCRMLDTEGYEKVNPLYQRVLSALIGEDEMDDSDHVSEGQEFFHYASDDSPCITFGSECKDADTLESDLDSSGELINSDTGTTSGFDENHLGGSPSFSNSSASAISSSDCQYQLMCLDDKLMLELQSIGLHPERVPDLAEGEDEQIIKEIQELKKGLYQKARKTKVKLSKIDKALLKEREVERREIEKIAMNKLVDMAYKRRMACRGGNYSRSGVSRVSKVAALAFVKRTITRCRKFEATGKSCFSESSLQKIILSASRCSNDGEPVDTVCTEAAANVPLAPGAVSVSVERPGPCGVKLDRGSNAFQSLSHSSVQTFAQCEPMSNRGKKREVLLEDVGNTASRAVAPYGEVLLGNVKGSRIERDRDLSTGNFVAKIGRPLLGGFRGERKTKTKLKQQKLVQLSASGNGLFDKVRETTEVYRPVSDFNETTTKDRNKVRGEVELPPPNKTHLNSSKETREPGLFGSLHLNDLDPASVSNDLDEPQDLTSWLDFDVDVQDLDSMGLEIPMDDLSEILM